ncbi:MAG: OmpA family protein [bacterium]
MKKINLRKVLLGVVFVVVMILIIFAIGSTAKAEEFVITGYGSGETAVKGNIEKQADEMVKSWGVKKPVKIIIQGFADKAGKTAENDTIARERAREVEAFINEKIDAGKITARSKGDLEDARKVVVTVEFVDVSASVPDQPIVFDSDLLSLLKKLTVLQKIWLGISMTFCALAIFILPLFVVRYFENRRKVERSTTVSKKPIELTINEQKYNFYPEITATGRLKTFYEPKPGKFMFVGTEKELKNSLRSSFKKNSTLVQELINENRLVLI